MTPGLGPRQVELVRVVRQERDEREVQHRVHGQGEADGDLDPAHRAEDKLGKRWRSLPRGEEAQRLFALMFYSPLVADQLRNRRKTVTIRLGDKTGKYRKGMVVPVLVGQRFGPRERVFDAVIDKVEVKPLGDVSPREIQHENPELRHLDEFIDFLRRLYNREVSEDDVVTVIHFSEIREAATRDARRRRGPRRDGRADGAATRSAPAST